MTRPYTLNHRNEAIPAKTMLEVSAWLADEGYQRRVAGQTEVGGPGAGGCRVSTVFLMFDHAFLPGSPPVLFETMVFGGPHDQDQRRYHTWDEAAAGHAEVVALMQRLLAAPAPPAPVPAVDPAPVGVALAPRGRRRIDL